jgi:predicted nucleotidyltransferase
MNKNEIRILKELIASVGLDFTISDISRLLKQEYSQTYRCVKTLLKKNLIVINNVGNTKVVKLDFSRYHTEYALVELERLNNSLTNKDISSVFNKILKVNKQFICVLFGSYALGKSKKSSDIDLLFIVPGEYDSSKFNRIVKDKLSIYNVDINIITEESLFEMWSYPEKLNVGNELFRAHVILMGAESFINLLRKHHVGR